MSYSKEERKEIIDTVCQHMASGMSVKRIFDTAIVSISRSLFYEWLLDDKEFSDKYARAIDIRSDILFDEIIEIADDQQGDVYIDKDGNEQTDHNVINRSRLRVDARKWAASKMNPKKYGDKLDLTSDGAKITHNPIFGDNPLDNNV